MPPHPNTRALWDGKRTGNAVDANKRLEIEERVKQRKPLRIADKAFLRDVLHVSVMIVNGKDVLT